MLTQVPGHVVLPGTGKTTTLVEAILQCMRIDGIKVKAGKTQCMCCVVSETD